MAAKISGQPLDIPDNSLCFVLDFSQFFDLRKSAYVHSLLLIKVEKGGRDLERQRLDYSS